MKQPRTKRKPPIYSSSYRNKRDNPAFMRCEAELNKFHPGPDRENSERK